MSRWNNGLLSEREMQVMGGFIVNQRLTDIAKILGVNIKTASTYRVRIILKLGLQPGCTNAEIVERYFIKRDEDAARTDTPA